MGVIGTAAKGFSTSSLIGKSTEALDRYTNYMDGSKNIREDFGLEFASNAQIEAIRSVLKGIREYDRSYDSNKTPFLIEKIEINRVTPAKTAEEIERDRWLMGKKMQDNITIHFSAVTKPDTDNAVINAMDTKYRGFLIGRSGGYYTYAGKSRKAISSFDARYGSRM